MRSSRGTWWGPNDFANLPSRPRGELFHEGYVYVLRFSTGAVKVGRTSDPRGRVASHAGDADKFGQTVERVWLSPIHGNYERNERKLIAWCDRRAAETYRSEYFAGVQFDRVVRFARTLRFTPLTQSERDRETARRERIAERWRAAAQSYVRDPRWQPIDALLGGPSAWTRLDVASGNTCTAKERDDLVTRLAAALGREPSDIASMSYIDLLTQCAQSLIKLAAANLTIWAYENERTDLTRKGIFSTAKDVAQ